MSVRTGIGVKKTGVRETSEGPGTGVWYSFNKIGVSEISLKETGVGETGVSETGVENTGTGQTVFRKTGVKNSLV